VVLLNLQKILEEHRQSFKNRLVESLAAKHSISCDEVIVQFGDSVDNILESRYAPLKQVAEAICTIPKPVLLNIRRDRQREDTCKICQTNEANIQAVDEKYNDSISIFEISEDTPAGALYHVLFKGAPDEDKKLPLTAIIYNCDVKRVWAGKSVDSSVYASLIKKTLRTVAEQIHGRPVP
jgi:hypothetical protein